MYQIILQRHATRYNSLNVYNQRTICQIQIQKETKFPYQNETEIGQ